MLTTSCVYVCMVWPHRQLPALAGGEQATSRQNELPSPTQLSERSRELRPHRPRYLHRSARTPKLQQCTLDARRFVGDQGEGVGRTTLRTLRGGGDCVPSVSSAFNARNTTRGAPQPDVSYNPVSPLHY